MTGPDPLGPSPRTVHRPTCNVSGGRGAVATEVLWTNRPLARQGRLGKPEVVAGR